VEKEEDGDPSYLKGGERVLCGKGGRRIKMSVNKEFIMSSYNQEREKLRHNF